MKVPLLDLHKQLAPIKGDLKEAFARLVDSAQFILGPQVQELERRIAAYSSAAYGCGVSSGTDALLLSLMALDIKPGDWIITTPYSFFATAGVIARLNARPVFIDIDEDSFNLSPDKLETWFNQAGADADKVKAIIPVHLYGQCADMDRIQAICEPRGIPVIEDAAQAIGATYPSRDGIKKAGGMGLFGCFSFFPSKNLGAMGDAGMVVTQDEAMAQKLALLRNHGATRQYYHAMVGGNFRLDTIQALALLIKLPHLDTWHGQRRENAARYDELFAGSPIKTPKPIYGRQHHIYNQYVITVPDRRDALRTCLTDAGIGHQVYYPVPFHRQDCFAGLGHEQGDFPAAEYAAAHTVALPVFSELTGEQQAYVAETILDFYG